MSTLIEPHLFRVPADLTVTPLTVRRVLIVGSCLAESWAQQMAGMPVPVESDLYLLGRDLPDTPAKPISEYDFQLVQLALRFILPDSAFAKLGQADVDGHEKLFAHTVNGIRRFLEAGMKWNRRHGLLTFVFPFIVPQQNFVGRLLPRYDIRNPVYFIEKLNEALAKEIAAYKNTYLFDLNEIISTFGRKYVQEDMFMAFNHGGFLTNYDFEHDRGRLEAAGKATDYFEERRSDLVSASWRELMALFRSVRQTDMVKMVVIDLDDTLWRGVTAELEIDDLPTSEGWPRGFWEALLFLKRRGIVLAIISKNEESRVLEFWNKILRQQLTLDDFVVRKINWRPKVENMAEILATVNLLARNILYIDDNPAERVAMKASFPEMRVLGGTPLNWRRILLWSAETQGPNVTAESAARTEMMRAQVTREENRALQTREEFLATLNVKLTMFAVDSIVHPRFARALELINKTNQFNTTGRRWTQEECAAALASGGEFYAFEVTDAYTDYGLVGVLILDSAGIQQFVMSCRILGLEAEFAAVALMIGYYRSRGAEVVVGAMVETDRNLPCRDLYARCGFGAVPGGWRRSTASALPVPNHINVDAPPGLTAASPRGRIAGQMDLLRSDPVGD